ncbi:hypothetical protein [Natranaeroarchaeum sulfidigenes]|uniref:Uncharacterized protein n=1 Tax=Natranaeroarchaeum sulfidigenes TaxID=2784880 RepID=A0A897MRM0_9EURY|nr:hypothetical protein [Natranaeroarchaeum sulfidigenes]QSG02668.1 hypothetical protein AArcS_1455 [Natranaeroarchaeum sulfidigenes]
MPNGINRTQSVTDGLRYFTPRSTRTHRAAFGLGFSIWFLSIVATPFIVTGDATTIAVRSTLVAATITSVYFVVLSLLAIGSPVGNLIAPGAFVAVTPGPLYRLLLPDLNVSNPAVVPFTEVGGFAVPGLLAGLFLPVVLLTGIYTVRPRPREWEANIMPDGFSFIELVHEQGERTRRSPMTEVLPQKFGFVEGALFVLLLVVPGALSVALPTYVTSPGDILFSLVVLFGATFVHFNRTKRPAGDRPPD